MSQAIEVKVPDIGDFKDVPVIDVLVKPGDAVNAEDALVTLESDKATMDVPSPRGGTVREVRVKAGDQVSEGSLILVLDSPDEAAAGGASSKPAPPSVAEAPPAAPAPAARLARAQTGTAATPGRVLEVKVPDIGDFKDVPVIEVLVKAGDAVQADEPLVTLESDKATMDVPSPAAGTVREVRARVGDKVSEGVLLLLLEASGVRSSPSFPVDNAAPPSTGKGPSVEASEEVHPEPSPPTREPLPSSSEMASSLVGGHKAHASPSVRRFARELGVDVSRVSGTGPKGRILKEDVQAYVKGALARPAGAAAAPVPGAAGLELLPWPKIDFAKFGPVEAKPLSRIRKISGANLARNWVMVPHVTQFEDADITELEAFRVQLNKENEKSGVKLTLLAFLIKAAVAALRKYPEFNSSLDGDNLVLKHYYHIGFAADTPNGLVVPVIRDADRKGVFDLAGEMAELSKKAREGKLQAAEMQGGCFSISSLGGIGGTAFTPIINAPEVAILGVSKAQMRPQWDGRQFVPRLVLPLSLSYDHRVIDGALAARFAAHLSQLLGDMRRAVL